MPRGGSAMRVAAFCARLVYNFSLSGVDSASPLQLRPPTDAWLIALLLHVNRRRHSSPVLPESALGVDAVCEHGFMCADADGANNSSMHSMMADDEQ
eukprot:856251-Pleurochrysis_carterae.AAC.1